MTSFVIVVAVASFCADTMSHVWPLRVDICLKVGDQRDSSPIPESGWLSVYAACLLSSKICLASSFEEARLVKMENGFVRDAALPS